MKTYRIELPAEVSAGIKAEGEDRFSLRLGKRMTFDVEADVEGGLIMEAEVRCDLQGHITLVGRQGRQTDGVLVMVRTRGAGPTIQEGQTVPFVGSPDRLLYGEEKVNGHRVFDTLWELLPGDALEVQFADGSQEFVSCDHNGEVFTGLRALNVAGRYA